MNARVMVAIAISLSLVSVLAVSGCEKTDHENIEKWMKTEKGPGKLKKALADSGTSAELAAHAAENLVRLGQDKDVKTAFAAMSADRANAVMAQLAPRLWSRARIEGENTVPSPLHITAKDALFDLRKYADDATRTTIDGYLVDWYAVSFYDKRANLGANLGMKVLRAIGPAAADRMMQAANQVVAQPAGENRRVRIGDELMRGLAVTGDPKAVKYVLDIAIMDRGDDTLTERAMSALYTAYIEPDPTVDAADPAALAPNIDAIVAIAKNETYSAQTTNDAVALIRAIGMPACLPALVGLVDHPHHDIRYRYVGANNAIRCGGAKAVVDVAHAFPDAGKYVAAELGGAVWSEIAKASPRDQVQAALRTLAKDPSWVSRWIAIEALAAMKSKEDIELIRGLSGDNTPLTGYWGDQEDVPAKDRKKEPTLGARAKELAASLGG
jgi:hypothetical protein